MLNVAWEMDEGALIAGCGRPVLMPDIVVLCGCTELASSDRVSFLSSSSSAMALISSVCSSELIAFVDASDLRLGSELFLFRCVTSFSLL